MPVIGPHLWRPPAALALHVRSADRLLSAEFQLSPSAAAMDQLGAPVEMGLAHRLPRNRRF